MAIAPVVVGKLADRFDLITALHIPIVAQLLGAAFFIIVIQCIRTNGLQHPVLARHWALEHGAVASTAEIVPVEGSL